MIRIAGVDIPSNKKVKIALTYIFGIGLNKANKIILQTNIDSNKKAGKLTDGEISKIREVILNSFKIEGDLKKIVSMNIKRLVDINCYRGIRHRKNLTVRGQRTHSNAKSCRKRKKLSF